MHFFFYKLQSRARTHAVLVIGLNEFFGRKMRPPGQRGPVLKRNGKSSTEVLHAQGNRTELSTFSRMSHIMFYILKAVTQNDLHSQGSRTQQSTFSRQSHRTICILKAAAQNVPDSQDRRTKRSFYILKAVTQSVLLSQYSPTEPSIFTR